MVHDYGPGQRFATVHVEMDMREDPMACHDIIDDIERDCWERHRIHLCIHYDPIVTDDAELNHMRKLVQQRIQALDPRAFHPRFSDGPGRQSHQPDFRHDHSL